MNRRPAATILCGVLLAALATSSVEASSYQKTDGTIVDPILKTAVAGGGDHAYSGTNLEPGGVLGSANLNYASLRDADLTGANLDNPPAFVPV